MSTAHEAQARTNPSASAHRRWSLKVDLVGLVLLFVLVAGASTVYQRSEANRDASQAAAEDARFAARLAAQEIEAGYGALQSTVATLAANPGIAQAIATPGACTLDFAGAGPFTTGHIDLVTPDGAVACSSLPVESGASYADASWWSETLTSPVSIGLTTDSRTGKQVLLAATPVPTGGVVVAIGDLDTLAAGLAERLGGPGELEFLVTTSDETTALSRSIEPAVWAGASLTGTPFADADGTTRRDVDGDTRLYGSDVVETLGWRVYAGADRGTALGPANDLVRRELVITLVGLLAIFLAAVVIHRRIARPLEQLSGSVRAATRHHAAVPIPVSGPMEVASLAEDFVHLIATSNRELLAASQLAAIVESSADAIIGTTLDGVVTTWNAGAERMYGYQADEVIGHETSRLVPAERAEELPLVLRAIAQGERLDRLETERVRKDGSVIDVSISVSPIQNAAGSIVGASVIERNISERKRAEADRQALEDRLHQSERLESLGQLAGGVAHDFNNLLAVILNYASFVAEQVPDEATRADVEEIRAAAERAAGLTRQLLIFGRRETIQPEVLDLNHVVTEVNSLLARSIGEDIELYMSLAADLPFVRVDRGQLEQILLNLAVNARDAMPDGGTLTIETDLTELDGEYVRLHPDVHAGSYVQLSVSDTGTGMSEEVIARAFEPFFTTKPKGKGTGLGLATVYGIVIEAGGSVTVYSEAGLGTTFRVLLPVTTEAIGPKATSGDTHSVGGNGETILVVEDEPAMMEVACRILRRNGYAVLQATTGTEALSLAADHDVQLLLTDSVMPQMSGRELANRIVSVRPGLAVLFMSGYSRGVLGAQSLLDDGIALIEKPFNERSLLAKVRTMIDGPPTS